MMVSKESLIDFLTRIDYDFSPSLSSKVLLSDYALKILEKAELIIETSTGVIVGLVVVYCNDLEGLTGYIPLVGVVRDSRGEGIAKRMMLRAIKLSKIKGMRRILIHSNNAIAVRLYQNLGFHIIEDGERKLLELNL